jgi:fluoroacetyl-CoA thioesterase
MREIPPGTSAQQPVLVTPEYAIDFLGHEDARVLSTPHMIGFMEMTARNTILPFLDPDEDSVGTVVDVRHLAATPVGMSVQFSARVLEVDRRRVLFQVEARDEHELVGEGRHERFVIHVPRFASKVGLKRTTQP